MAENNPHIKHSYSSDQITLSAFTYELNSVLALNKDRNNEALIVETYLRNRIIELKDRWK